MYLLGVEHGSRAIRISLDHDGVLSHISIPRTGDPTPLPELLRGPVPDIVVASYSMGDGLVAFTPLTEAESMGLAGSGAAGTILGTGTDLLNRMGEAGWPVYLVPGVHSASPGLRPQYRHFSHIAAGDKVLGAILAVEGWGPDLIMVDASTNTVSLLIENGLITGGLDALALAPGLVQGPLDLGGLRAIEGGCSPQEVFSSAGIIARRVRENGETMKEAHELVAEFLAGLGEGKQDEFEELDTLCDLCVMEVGALYASAVVDVSTVVLTGLFPELDPRSREHALSRVRGRIEHLIGPEACPVITDLHHNSDGALLAGSLISAGAEMIMNFPVSRD